MTTLLPDSIRERLEWLEESRVRAAEGAARVGKRLREVEEAGKRQTVRLVLAEDCLERISKLPHLSSHTGGFDDGCAACMAASALGGDNAADC